MASLRNRLMLLSGLAAAVTGVGALTLTGAANATAPVAASLAVASDEPLPPSSVESLNYPNAASIQQAKNILLKRGDGNITLLESCDGTPDIELRSRVAPYFFCFDVRDNPGHGFLTLELARTYYIRTQQYAVTATISAQGQQEVVQAPANTLTPIGEGNAEAETAVVELRVRG